MFTFLQRVTVDERIDTTLLSVCSILRSSQELASLLLYKDWKQGKTVSLESCYHLEVARQPEMPGDGPAHDHP